MDSGIPFQGTQGRGRVLQAFVRVFFLFLAVGGGAADAADKEFVRSRYQETRWEELIPLSWHPEKALEGMNVDELSDDDPRAVKAMEAFMAEWRKAPTNPEMQGRLVRLPGFVAPLDWNDVNALKEFLLVPYFGACIHVPPPPANQIVHVTLDEARAGLESMTAIWVYGEITLERHEADMGTSGYAMRADHVEPYTEE